MNFLNGSSTLIKDAEVKTVGDNKTVVNLTTVQRSPRDSKKSVFWTISLWPSTEAQTNLYSSLEKGTVIGFGDLTINSVYTKDADAEGKVTSNISASANRVEILHSTRAPGEASEASSKPAPTPAPMPRPKVNWSE